MVDVLVAFAAELHNEIKPPEGWEWYQSELVAPRTAKLVNYSKRVTILVFSDPGGPIVRLFCRGREADEHMRQYDWEDPLMLDKMVNWMNWVADTWSWVSDHWDEVNDAKAEEAKAR